MRSWGGLIGVLVVFGVTAAFAGPPQPGTDKPAPPDDSASPPDDSASPPDDSASPPDDSASPPDDSASPPDDSAGFGDEDGDDWGDEGGDDDPVVDDIAIDDADLDIGRARSVSITGFLRTDWGFWVERLGDNDLNHRDLWAKGRQSLDLKLTAKESFFRLVLSAHVEYDLRYLGDWIDHKDAGSAWATDDFETATEDEYRFQLLPREAFAAFTFGPVELKTGWQIAAWGEGDALSIADVVNPRDLREPGLSDLDDIRMAVLASSVGVQLGNHAIEFMVLHEAYFGLRSTPLGPYSNLKAVLSDSFVKAVSSKDAVGFRHIEDRFAFDQQQPLLRWVYKGPGLDIGVYAAYVMDRIGVISLDPATLLPALIDPSVDRLDIPMRHPFYGAVGTHGAAAAGSWLFKWELGTQINKSFNVGDSVKLILDTVERTTVDVMGGITWTPITDLQLAVEYAKSTFVSDPGALLFPIDRSQAAFRLMWRTLNERLTVAAAYSMFFGVDSLDQLGFLARASVEYEFFDGFSASVGYVHYTPSTEIGLLSGLGDHDQVFLRARWDFTIL